MKPLLFSIYKQHDAMDCGPTCLRMVAKHFGKSMSHTYVRDKCLAGRNGTSLLELGEAAERLGMRSLSMRVAFDTLEHKVSLPCIAHWHQEHFIVVYAIKRGRVYVADPSFGRITYTRDEFLHGWLANESGMGTVLLLEPSRSLAEQEEDHGEKLAGFAYVLSYLKDYRKFLFQLFGGMIVGSLLQLIFPFLTQSLVDLGINHQNLGFVYTILVAQLMLFVGRTTVEFIRSWILLHLGARINIAIISDFLIKLMKLPLAFFDSRTIGDIIQRIGDNSRVQAFVTSTLLGIVFAVVNLFVFGAVLAWYSFKIFWIFFVASFLMFGWIFLFLKKRRKLDFTRFRQMSENQSIVIQLIGGMQEIRINGAERQKRWEWEHSQANLFKTSIKSLIVNQYQQVGMLSINELKNILITFLAAKEVIEGNMTLGMMMAVTYIMGQLSSPIDQLLGFAQSAQDAKLSLERLREIHVKEDEDAHVLGRTLTVQDDANAISIENLSFRYGDSQSPLVLKQLSAVIPSNKTMAIVGVSGSGKTTLMKLLLKVYSPVSGSIKVAGVGLADLEARSWRLKCGVVMQNGYIFPDTIANNIALGEDNVDEHKLKQAVDISNLRVFVDSLPQGFQTVVGANGQGLSQGQMQRILIARCVYRNPQFVFFDEATSSLDAENEAIIMKNLSEFLKGRTTVIIAHRLSTVRNANQIIVIDKGRIVEQGTHSELTKLHRVYYNLVRNQLELGN